MEVNVTPLASTRTIWRHVDPRCQLLVGAALAVVPFFLRTLPGAAAAFVLALLLLASARPSWRSVAARLGGVGVFLLLVVLLLPWTLGGPYWEWGALRLSLPGLRLGLFIPLRALTMVTVVTWLLTLSSVERLLKAAQDLGVPRFVTSLLLLTHRYLHLLLEELNRLRMTLRVRGYRHRPTRHCYRTVAHVAGGLLVRGYERAERVNQAMTARGFTGEFRLLRDEPWRRRNAVVAMAAAAALAAVPLALDAWMRS